MADQEAAAKKAVEDSAAAQAKMVADAEERQNARPTPTQEENDLAKSGVNVVEKEDDGSGPERRPGESKEDAKARADKEGTAIEKKESKPASASTGYQTRDQQSQQSREQQSGAGRTQPRSTENK
jgi:hypothetical protein